MLCLSAHHLGNIMQPRFSVRWGRAEAEMVTVSPQCGEEWVPHNSTQWTPPVLFSKE